MPGYIRRMRKSPLTETVLIKILLVSLFMILGSAAIQVTLEYRRETDSLRERMDELEDLYGRSLAAGLYSVDGERVELLLQSIIRMEGVVYAEATERRGDRLVRFSAGDPGAGGDILRRYPLSYPGSGGELFPLGTLTVRADAGDLHRELRRKGVMILLENSIIVSLLGVIIFVLIEHTVTRHLRRVTGYAEGLNLEELDQPLRLERAPSERRGEDEFDQLADAINRMRRRIALDLEEKKRHRQERRRLEESRHHAQKMESVGRLAGGIAHDLNNLLTPVLVYSEMIASLEGVPPRGLRYAGTIEETARKAKELINQLLTFSRKSAASFVPVELNRTVGRFEQLLRRTLRENVQIIWEPNSRPLTVLADRGKIEQIIMNLSINAQDAMPEGGRLTIRLERGAPPRASAEEEGAERSYARLSFRDNGAGMSREVRERIFEPFFSTKGEGGTGLGLATVFGIVRQHEGFIEVSSREGEGTLMTVGLPLAEQGAPEPEAALPSSSAAPSGGDRRVLLVEDNAPIRRLTRNLLEEAGFRVCEACDGEEASALLRNPEEAVHLLLTDVMLPGMSGRELFEASRRERPGLRVLYMSGYSDRILSPEERERGPFLAKPFSREELLAKLRESLV